MLIKASKRGGAKQLARHLMNREDNEIITVHEVSGFMESTVSGALHELHCVSKGIKSKQFLFSVSLNPPENETASIAAFEEAIERIEKKVGLEGQPRIVVFHEKHGRRHAHLVLSRINTEKMIAIDQPYFKTKLNELARELYIENQWQLPRGFLDHYQKSPLNFSRAEMEQAARIGRKASDIKRELQDCWHVSDNKKSFQAALKDGGYKLAKGDRKNIHMVVDVFGEAYPLRSKLGIKINELAGRIGKAEKLPTIAAAQRSFSKDMVSVFERHLREAKRAYKIEVSPLLRKKEAMSKRHTQERAQQKLQHKTRWQIEEVARSKRVRRGFNGAFDRLTGAYKKVRKRNERESWHCYLRDQAERDDLIAQQLSQRQDLQHKLDLVREAFEQERAEILRDAAHIRTLSQAERAELEHYFKDIDRDHERER